MGYPCFSCKGDSVPHPDRHSKNHPYPELSFKCIGKCKDGDGDLLLCSGCLETQPDWWYPLEELWDDMIDCRKHNLVLCPGCWQHSNFSGEIEKRYYADDFDDTQCIPCILVRKWKINNYFGYQPKNDSYAIYQIPLLITLI